jgi:CRP-like cAMP-binding protein
VYVCLAFLTGDSFGEVAMLFGQARTATVVSVTTTELSILSKPDLISIVTRFEECAQVFEENIARYAIVRCEVRMLPAVCVLSCA